MNTKQRMLVETTARRDEAEALLRVLIDARTLSEQNLAKIGRPDLVKKVTGRSSMDNAVASAQRLVESFNRVLTDLRESVDEADLSLLAALDSTTQVARRSVAG
jgi:hypothetical protein